MTSFISREQDYALRIVSALGSEKERDHIPISELSERFDISRIFAGRIAQKLGKGGILGSERGKFGGIFLKKKPEEITLFEILSIIGFTSRMNLCLSDSLDCRFEAHCHFHHYFAKIEHQIIKDFKNKKLSDFISK